MNCDWDAKQFTFRPVRLNFRLQFGLIVVILFPASIRIPISNEPMSMSFFQNFLASLPDILFFLFLIAGIIAAAVKMDAFPIPAKWVIGGLILIVVGQIAVWLGASMADYGSIDSGNSVISAVAAMKVLLNIMGMSMLIVAAFSDRGKTA